MLKRLAVFAVAAAALSSAFAFDQDHAAWTRALETFNKDGLVDYKTLKADPSLLDAYLNELAAVDPDAYASWGMDEKIAFWINAYNAYTWKAIIENYPIKASFLKSRIYPKNSIRQIDGVWDEMTWDVMGRKLTLNHMEHEILRKEFNEPRIHVALVCAAMGCPQLREEAFTGARLDAQLEDQTKTFLATPGKFRIDREDNTVHVSSIFKWFGEDFIRKYGSEEGFGGKSGAEAAVLRFASEHLPDADRDVLAAGGYGVEYLDYDWTLNEQ